MSESTENIARYLDHTVLAPAATDADMARGCEIARQFGTAAAFVKPHFVIEASKILAGSTVKVGTVVGFPQGLALPSIQADEAEMAIDMGAREIDMVANTGKVLSEDWDYVSTCIAGVAEVVKSRGLIIKVIFETCYLADSHKIMLCRICEQAGVHFAKTSTGFGPGGATEADVALMARHLKSVKVKAAGGIRTLEQVRRYLDLGASRIGTSSTQQIMAEVRAN